tara:strand:+ start:514 stop:678 length:165 start_codon:yes stop_codon:yes gene_type:complete
MKSRLEIARKIAEKVHLEPNEKYLEVLNFLGVDGSKQQKDIIFDKNKDKWVEKN